MPFSAKSTVLEQLFSWIFAPIAQIINAVVHNQGGEVGLVLSRELSRLSRTDKDWCSRNSVNWAVSVKAYWRRWLSLFCLTCAIDDWRR